MQTTTWTNWVEYESVHITKLLSIFDANELVISRYKNIAPDYDRGHWTFPGVRKQIGILNYPEHVRNVITDVWNSLSSLLKWVEYIFSLLCDNHLSDYPRSQSTFEHDRASDSRSKQVLDYQATLCQHYIPAVCLINPHTYSMRLFVSPMCEKQFRIAHWNDLNSCVVSLNV